MAAPQPLLITNRIQPQAIGDAIAAMPAAWALAKAGIIGSIHLTCKSVVGLFDLGIPQFYQEPGMPRPGLLLETQATVSHGIGGWSLPALYGKRAGVDEAALGWPPCTMSWPPEAEPAHIILSPFSYSDRGTDTKRWAWRHWVELAALASASGLQVHLLAGSAEEVAAMPLQLATAIQAVQVARPLNSVAARMLAAKAVVTVDNGMGWLAQAISAPHVQILSSNMPTTFSWDHGPRAINVSNCQTASASEVWRAVETAWGLRTLQTPSSIQKEPA